MPRRFYFTKKTTILILSLTCLFSCRKEPNQPPPAVPYGVPVTVTVNENQPGYTIPATFEGLSFETQILTADPDFLNANNAVLIQMIKNLGPGLLRIGGGTSDEIYWSENGNKVNMPADSINAADIDRLSAFSKATGWQVLFGLNLGTDDPVAITNEAIYVNNSFAGNLYAFQSGNEPDVYYAGMRTPNYNYTTYQGEWETYFSAVRNSVPLAPFAGPDVAYNSSWIGLFAENENSKIKLLDGHYYTTGPATDPTIGYETILEPVAGLTNYLQGISAEAQEYKLPYRISESNNVYGGGKKGVSDVFASALWALDVMWTVAENNGAGINFHDGQGLCYSPVLIQNSVPTAGPEYYAMLAFKYGSTGGTLIPTTIDRPEICSAYACVKADKSYSITLINKDDTQNYAFTVQLNNPVSTIQIAWLTAPSITSATGVTFAGGVVGADGSFETKTIKQYVVSGKSIVVNMPAGSAAVVTIPPN